MSKALACIQAPANSVTSGGWQDGELGRQGEHRSREGEAPRERPGALFQALFEVFGQEVPEVAEFAGLLTHRGAQQELLRDEILQH